jgi:hypothetical protein
MPLPNRFSATSLQYQFNPNLQAITVSSLASCAKDQPIYDNRDTSSNGENLTLFLFNGIVLENNPQDTFYFAMGLSEEDPYVSVRQDILDTDQMEVPQYPTS